MMRAFVFITDTHFRNSSNVRTGDLIQDLASKLEFVVAYANDVDATILIGGDLFDKPSVPDVVKNTLAPILMKAKYTPIAIFGNHDLLYNNEEFLNRTSYETWASHGIIKSLDNEVIEFEDCVLTNQAPFITKGKPQIIMFHGFLNKEDGRNTFLFQDVAGVEDQTYVLLGHDHVAYEPMQYSANIKFFRPGSFNRQTRGDESMRIPELIHIRVNEGRFQFKMVPITTARSQDEIFVTKLKNVTKAQQRETYEDIINQIKNANSGELSLQQALEQVATEDVCNYALRLLNEKRLEDQHNKGNL